MNGYLGKCEPDLAELRGKGFCSCQVVVLKIQRRGNRMCLSACRQRVLGWLQKSFIIWANSSSGFSACAERMFIKAFILLRAVINMFHFYLIGRVTRITIYRHVVGVLLMQRPN